MLLVVDDSKSMRNIIKRVLTQAGFGDYEVKEATTGKEALEIIKKNPPELIITDWSMPEMTGIKLLEEVKKIDSKMKCGFISSAGSMDMQVEAKAMGAEFYIQKPFTPEQIHEVLTPILSEATWKKSTDDNKLLDLRKIMDVMIESMDKLAKTTLGMSKCEIASKQDKLPWENTIGAYIPMVSPECSIQIGIVSTVEGCRRLGCSMLGMNSYEELSDEYMIDSIMEIANILAGMTKTDIQDNMPLPKVGLPIFIDGYIKVTEAQDRASTLVYIGNISAYLIVIQQKRPFRA